MTTPTIATPPQAPEKTALQPRRKRFNIVPWLILAALAGGVYFASTRWQKFTGTKKNAVPTTRVEQGDVSFTIVAKGDLRGGNPESLTAPQIGGSDIHITYLAKNGSPVQPGDVVAKFDTSEQEYKLKEAIADVDEAEQKIEQAKANRDAQKEEDSYQLLKAKDDVTLAELEVRRNPLLPPITAKQNELALAAAREHLAQVQQNLANRAQTTDAGIAKEEAGRAKAASQAKTAKENIDSMVLRAGRAGYVSIVQNTNLNFVSSGMELPVLQEGDAVWPGMAVAQIPDLNSWEIGAAVAEADRGHIHVGDAVTAHVIAVPGRTFHGHISNLGGTVGNFWEHHFECKASLDDPTPDLRPGMSAEVVISTETMKNALSIPAQALFDANGTYYVYVGNGKTFTRRDVKLVRRNETRAVITNVHAGETVALADPTTQAEKHDAAASPMKAGPR